MIHRVDIATDVLKSLVKLPAHIGQKLLAWTALVERDGLEEARKVPGYHDEPLRGKRKGQRSIRLSRAYRAIYVVRADGGLEFVSVEDVSKHEY